MKAVVIYESMFGNTRAVATAIAAGIGEVAQVEVVRVADVDEHVLAGADLLIVGGPTHAHGRSRPSTRMGARSYVEKDSSLRLETGADTGPGVRDLDAVFNGLSARAAAFDTRMSGPPLVTGRASKGIERALRRAGLDVVAPPESFLVDRDNHLLAGELERAEAWGVGLATHVRAAPARTRSSR